jgi:acyl-CoA thioesterase FadM
MNAFAGWVGAFLAPFPKLVSEHQCGLVVAGARVEYVAPLSFWDASTLTVESSVRFLKSGSLAEVRVRIVSDQVVRLSCAAICRVINLAGDASLSALPGKLPAGLSGRLAADEWVADAPIRPVPALLCELADVPSIAQARRPMQIFRHMVEVADQWSFIEMAAFAGEGREALAAEQMDAQPLLRRGLSEPVRLIQMEYRRPMFLLDQGTIETQAQVLGERLFFTHRVLGDDGELRGIAIEEL